MVFRIFLLFASFLYGETIDTFYGPVEVEEPVLLELIHCPAMQRLKQIHQYGVSYYTTHREEYNRYDNSVGVFAILRKNGASLEEQTAGLLHDVSHTVFSHVGDWLFGKENQEHDYQSTIFKLYLADSGVEKILIRHGLTIDHVLPKDQKFMMLEQPLPNLCADRIDYNIQGAFFRGFLQREEALELYEDLQFIDGRWMSHQVDLLTKIARFSLFMTQDCWGAADNYARSRWLADAMILGLDTGLLSWHEIHFGIDQDIWDKLMEAQDPLIQEKMDKILNPKDHYKWVDPKEANLIIQFRCRGIDPWVIANGQIVRLTEIDRELAQEFEEMKEKAAKGWAIQLY